MKLLVPIDYDGAHIEEINIPKEIRARHLAKIKPERLSSDDCTIEDRMVFVDQIFQLEDGCSGEFVLDDVQRAYQEGMLFLAQSSLEHLGIPSETETSESKTD